MERVVEDLHEWEKDFQAADIYGSTANFTEFVFSLGSAEEEENIYQTDGPEKRTIAKIIVTEKLDKNASLRLHFSAEGISRIMQQPTMKIRLEAKLELEFPDTTGPAYDSYIAFYLSHMRPRVKDIAEHSVDSAMVKLREFLKQEFTLKEI
ncbi:MAG: hypothetical protein HY364_02885 [Candidatus Aenigmarchaeota archaeon]|nr:hypothetical protein [Candidatus Aenigmarchaeota archaeon]